MNYYQAIGATSLQSTAKAAAEVVSDPHLPEIVCHVTRLKKIEAGQNPGPSCPKVSLRAAPGKGIGLRHAIVPIRLAVKAREKPLLAVATVGAVVGAIFALGYATGRRKR